MPESAVLDVPVTEPEPAPPEPLESGDWVWTIYWRAFALSGNPNNGSWQTTYSRIVSPGKLICHEVSNASDASLDGSGSGSLLRWCPPARVFRTRDDALEACRTLPAPP